MSSLKQLPAKTAVARPKSSGYSKDMSGCIPTCDFIPVGCLRLNQSQLGLPEWETFSSKWANFPLQQKIYSLPSDSHFLPDEIQVILFNHSLIRPYVSLVREGWIRMEFKTNADLAQIRVYVSPDDSGRTIIRKSHVVLRRLLQRLLGEICISPATWEGHWKADSLITHLDPSRDQREEDHASLFEIFNTLPSPNPDPNLVRDYYPQTSIRNLLSGRVDGLTTKMHRYQRRSAATMLQRESQPDLRIDPRLTLVTDQNGNPWYCDFITGTCLREATRFETAKGGILAETMGLGKTLICLALILATKNTLPEIPVQYSIMNPPQRPQVGGLFDMVADKIKRTGVQWKEHFARLEKKGYMYSECVRALKNDPSHYLIPDNPVRVSRHSVNAVPQTVYLSHTTLVIVPSNLVKQWEREIQKHTTGLRVLVVAQPKQELPAVEQLIEYDILLFSKQRFEDVESVSLSKIEKDQNRSSLRQIHFKRLITDEGHNFGSSSASKTIMATVLDSLHISARWIVSGTPTKGLYGIERFNSMLSPTGSSPISQNNSCEYRITQKDVNRFDDIALQNPEEYDAAFYKEERKDLDRLGNIATVYLKSRPWTGSPLEGNVLWSQYVLQPRHGTKSYGNMACLRSTLEGMIIRHRAEDVERDIKLPPLHQDTVYLDSSEYDRMSLNMFSMMIVSNAVTSERKDADYLFHDRQRKALNQLVSNLRQASFHWSGYTTNDLEATVNISKGFLETGDVPVSLTDEGLLKEAIRAGEFAISNKMREKVSEWHEMPVYIQNDFSESTRKAWALDEQGTNPTVFGLTMVHNAQKFISHQLHKEDPLEGMVEAGRKAMLPPFEATADASTSLPFHGKQSKGSASSKKKVSVSPAKKRPAAATLAGGVTVSGESKRSISSRSGNYDLLVERSVNIGEDVQIFDRNLSTSKPMLNRASKVEVKSSLKKVTQHPVSLDPKSPLASACLIATSSSKLSYLIDQISTHYENEKILIFYESDNVAFYIAQALECLQIKHLIYAKSLSSMRKSQYVVTFNLTETFRVLLMDVSQAAFGLDISSASRVWFVNPVFSPQIEAQAVKRAHRIGQTKPVFVETLVLKGSIEEVILDRRGALTKEEHINCKNILDDETMYDWIRNARFFPVPDSDLGTNLMANLSTPQPVFANIGPFKALKTQNPNEDLIMNDTGPVPGLNNETSKPPERKRKAATVSFMTEASSIFGPRQITPDEDSRDQLNSSKKPRQDDELNST